MQGDTRLAREHETSKDKSVRGRDTVCSPQGTSIHVHYFNIDATEMNTEYRIWGPLLEGVFSSQRYLSLYMTRGFERPMVGPTPIEEAMPHKTEQKKLLITPVRGVWGPNTQTPP